MKRHPPPPPPPRRAYFRQRWEELAGSVFAAGGPAVFDTTGPFSYESFLWAAATVRARVHAPLEGEGLALVPLADAVRGCSVGVGV